MYVFSIDLNTKHLIKSNYSKKKNKYNTLATEPSPNQKTNTFWFDNFFNFDQRCAHTLLSNNILGHSACFPYLHHTT